MRTRRGPALGTPEERRNGLQRNCLDSISHGLAHFSANHSDDYGFHNQKWAILSVAHAAEAFCNLLLLTVDQGHPNGRKYDPLEKATRRLRGSKSTALSNGERYAVKEIFPDLAKQRDQLMHRVPPTVLDMKQPALALLALLYLMRHRTHTWTNDLFDQDPPIEQDVFDELGLDQQDVWFTMAEQLMLEDYGLDHLEHCGNCGHLTLTPDIGCQACFAAGD
jgi:hypothetical protein